VCVGDVGDHNANGGLGKERPTPNKWKEDEGEKEQFM